MFHQLTLDLPDDVFRPLSEAARQAGQSVEEWAAVQLRSCASASSKQATDLARLMAHAGVADLGRPTGADNESIDADLAAEYAPSHRGRSGS